MAFEPTSTSPPHQSANPNKLSQNGLMVAIGIYGFLVLVGFAFGLVTGYERPKPVAIAQTPKEKEQPKEEQQRYDKPLPELEKIGALWKRKSKRGTVYLSGVCHDEKIMVFAVKDEYRQNPKSPHYTIMRSKSEDDDAPF